MKTLTAKLAFCVLLISTIGLIITSAQITTGITFRSTKAFVVGETTMPEGSYTIRVVSGTNPATLEIASNRRGPTVKVQAHYVAPDRTIHAAEVAFNKYSTILALTQVFPGKDVQGYELVPGQLEKAAAKSEKPLRQTVPATGK